VNGNDTWGGLRERDELMKRSNGRDVAITCDTTGVTRPVCTAAVKQANTCGHLQTPWSSDTKGKSLKLPARREMDEREASGLE